MRQTEVARRLGVSVRTVARWRADEGLAFVPGRPVLLDWSVVERFLKDREVRVDPWGDEKILASLTQSWPSTGPGSGNCAGLNTIRLRVARSHALSLAGRLTGR